MPFIDIGANLTDSMFQGEYNGSQKHEADLKHVLERAWQADVAYIIITAGNLEEARKALELANDDPRLFTTVGVHPTRCGELVTGNDAADAEYMDNLMDLAKDGQKTGKIVAIGECGLDYDRLHFCTKEIQLQGFEKQFQLARETGLPMFLHNRNTGGDFVDMIRKHRPTFSQGVVHSFTDSLEEAQALIAEGINGCSFKTEKQLETIKALPLDKILLETDAPWCDIRPSHAGSKFIKTTWEAVKKEKYQVGKCVKNRQEPCHIRAVAEVIAGVKGIDLAAVMEQCYDSTLSCFPRFRPILSTDT